MEEKKVVYDEAEKIIDELYNEFSKEEINLKLQADNNSSKIEELEENILQFMKNDDIDYKVFSPRTVVNVNAGKIDGLRTEKNELEKINKNVLKQLKYYSEKTKKLEQLKKLLKKEDSLEIESEEETIISEPKPMVKIKKPSGQSIFEISLPNDLKKISHKLELCIKFIDNDTVRAKIELKNMIKNLEDLITSVKSE